MVLSSAFHFWKLLKGVKLNSEFRVVLATITFAKKKKFQFFLYVLKASLRILYAAQGSHPPPQLYPWPLKC